MHDPMTVAFEIRSPFWTHKPWPKGKKRWEDVPEKQQRGRSAMWRDGYRDTWATIWHVDPERDGSDDSCGWSCPRLTDRQREILKNVAWGEAREPWLRAQRTKTLLDPVLAETLCRAGLLQTADALRLKLSYDDACRIASRLVHNQLDNIRNLLCFMPGYHTNSEDETDKYWREQCAEELYRCFARALLRRQRPWWKHPRYHVHHWKLQIPFVQNVKRWLFSRCCKCGKGFAYGYSPTTSNWNAPGPRWFRSEPDSYHHDCQRPSSPQAAQSAR